MVAHHLSKSKEVYRMPNTVQEGYDKSIGTSDRSVVSATKLWAIVLAGVLLVGIIMIAMFLAWPFGGASSGPVSSENTAAGPAEP